MAGGYTNVTLAQLAVEEIVKRNLLHEEARLALQKWKKFVIVGSMGPDYCKRSQGIFEKHWCLAS